MQTYNMIDRQIHQLAQTIARFNRSYVPPKADDSHSNLALDPIAGRLLGRWAETPKERVILTLNLHELRFELFDAYWRMLYSNPVSGTPRLEAETHIKDFLPQLGLDAAPFMDAMPYEIPRYNFALDAFFPWEAEQLQDWLKQRSLANDACHWLIHHLQVEAEVRIWPHHFDTGIYFEPFTDLGLGFGLAMQDGLIDSPYYYFSAYGLNGRQIDFGQTVTLSEGQWIISKKWQGAILKMTNASRESLPVFIREVAQWYLHQ